VSALREVTPKSLVLDLLRVADERPIAIKTFVAVGALFGLTANAVRVAVARLVAAGTLESDERGSYRLAGRTAAIGRHVESWRLGERRMRRWDGGFLAVHLPRGAERTVRTRSRRALELLGFREGLDLIWLRPDNLSESRAETRHKLESLGLESDAQHFVASDFDRELLQSFKKSLFMAERLERGYRQARERIDASLRKLEQMPLERAAVETFLVGGSAIRILATDPLLPRDLMPTDERAALTDAMLAYDIIGRRIWKELSFGHKLGEAPVHLHSITVGSA
jgi:phenylacetic acid degradation operon negative regulatory protein